MSLFRTEAMRSQDRLHGDVDLAPPTSWQIISLGIAGSFVIAIGFLSIAHYGRVAVASGVVESTLGIVQATATVGGVISRVGVIEGQHVVKGQVIAILEHRTITAGQSLEERRFIAARKEAKAVDTRVIAIRHAADARVAAIEDEAGGARADLSSATEQMAEQRSLIQAAHEDLDKARSIAVRGFVSQQDLRRREETLATRQQGLSRLRQQADAARATLARSASDVEQERATLDASIGQMTGERAQVEQRATNTDAMPTTMIIAPVTGTVAGLAAAPGIAVAAGSTITSIVPDGGKLRLRLELPPEAVASISAGQDARVALDAFPYQTYGTIGARIDLVTPVAIRTSAGARFIAYATPATNSVASYGRENPIRPGMTAAVRIRTLDRSLMQWLLDPLYAVARR